MLPPIHYRIVTTTDGCKSWKHCGICFHWLSNNHSHHTGERHNWWNSATVPSIDLFHHLCLFATDIHVYWWSYGSILLAGEWDLFPRSFLPETYLPFSIHWYSTILQHSYIWKAFICSFYLITVTRSINPAAAAHGFISACNIIYWSKKNTTSADFFLVVINDQCYFPCLNGICLATGIQSIKKICAMYREWFSFRKKTDRRRKSIG